MKRINDAFERIVVVSSDRRPDRPATVTGQLRHFGIDFERFPASDGGDDGILSARDAYRETALAGLADDRPSRSTRESHRGDVNEAGGTAVRACDLLPTMTALVERALHEGWNSVLVLEGDVLLHRDTPVLFDRIMAEVPDDWAILQLGAMQLHWQEDWITWHSYHLYRCHGSSIGAHAFALRADVLPVLAELCRVRDLPFDLGALHGVKRRFADRCFTMFPNLAIQDATDSEIGMSTMFFREARQIDNIYRWHLPDYGLAAIQASRADPPEQPSLGETPTIVPRRGMGARVRDFLRVRRWRRPPMMADPNGASAMPGAPTTKPAPARQLGGAPPLKARSNTDPKAHAVVTLVVGLDREALAGVLDLVCTQRARTDVEPVLITDCDAFHLFRDRGLIFEYLPAPAQRERLAPELDWDLYVLRRLALIRRKWQPVRIVSFGARAGQLLAAWTESPFEDASIHQVAARPAASLGLA